VGARDTELVTAHGDPEFVKVFPRCLGVPNHLASIGSAELLHFDQSICGSGEPVPVYVIHKTGVQASLNGVEPFLVV